MRHATQFTFGVSMRFQAYVWGAALTATLIAGSAQAAVKGTLAFGTSANSVAGDSIVTGTEFTIGDLKAQPGDGGSNGTGVFANFTGADIGKVTFNTAVGDSFSLDNSVFGSFTSTSITDTIAKIGGNSYVNSVYIVGDWTPGSGVNATGPDLASFTFSFTQTNVGAISNSASFSIGSAPEPSTWAMMLGGFAALGFVGFRGRRTTAASIV
jgi:hypothetical protein